MTAFALHKTLETDSAFVRDLPLCQLRLQNQSVVPWLILVPRRAEAREIHQLDLDDREQLMEEIAQASLAIEQIWSPFKINVAALGNIVPQLHVHVIGRRDDDPAWPAPVWGNVPPAPYAAAELAEAKKKLDDYFAKASL